ncbi:MAG TPA: hypothetical protein VGW36_08235 [Pyrinomonadaceae bacterium]|nr:hypothetical protein [Pyrinomonadaceae bacterium]
MNDDYLWDRSGEPDPEVQRLEEVLSTLRYQPRPLEIPSTLQVGRRRQFFPLLAIAATVAFAVIGLGVWLGLRQETSTPVATNPITATITNPANTSTGPTISKVAEVKENTPVIEQVGQQSAPRQKRTGYRPSTAANRNRNFPTRQQLGAIERKEAEAAKDQLMLALRVASVKLSFAQKKTKGPASENVIHYQHKIG